MEGGLCAPRTEDVKQERTATQCTAIASGDADAFARFYRQWFDFAFVSARSVSQRDEAFCLDIVHDVMLKVIRSIPALSTEAELRAWLSVVVRRCAYDRLREERRRIARERGEDTLGEIPLDAARDLDDRLAWLRAELQAMPRAYRDVLDLRMRAGWTLARIAEHLGMKPGAVRGRISRAVEHLRRRAEEASSESD